MASHGVERIRDLKTPWTPRNNIWAPQVSLLLVPHMYSDPRWNRDGILFCPRIQRRVTTILGLGGNININLQMRFINLQTDIKTGGLINQNM